MSIIDMLITLIALVCVLIVVCIIAIAIDSARHAHRFLSRHKERRSRDRR